MRKSASFAAILSLAALLLSSCGLGTAETFTQTMQPAGNGAHTRVGDLQIEAAVLVAHADGGASLSASIVNEADNADAVAAIIVGQEQATLSSTEFALPSASVTRIGYNSDLHADVTTTQTVGAIVPVAVLFASGAQAELKVLVVAQTGMYASIDSALPKA